MDKIKISAVSYLNAKPFIYGLEHFSGGYPFDLQLDMPSLCAKKLIDGQVDIGLVPVAVLPLLKEYHIITDYCIGAEGKVASVMLYSMVPLPEIRSVLLDYQSRTSVTLVKILASELWNINPEWLPAQEGYENSIQDTTAAVIIGDRTFGLEGKYPYAYDLAEEWQELTGLPFVFACWVSNKRLPDVFIEQFNKSLKLGLDSRDILIRELATLGYKTDVANYLNNSIQYNYDAPKKEALRLFLSYISRF
ncbi:MAG: menaquinone biosynthesis protein [Bacteroidia bacterium]|jgi:chorismate dehydratase